jgi:YD repeat-containing protein
MIMTEDTTTSVEAVVGFKDGEVLPSGDIVKYDYDKNGQFIGWHKEAGGQ